MHCKRPRQVAADAFVFQVGPTGDLEVLLQRRAATMRRSPGHLAPVGGQRDETDEDSLYTIQREIREETGLVEGVVCGPLKFAEGRYADHYVVLVEDATFRKKAKTARECGDVEEILHLLPGTAKPAVCFGHIWIPIDDVPNIDRSWVPIMANADWRVFDARRHLLTAMESISPGRVIAAGPKRPKRQLDPCIFCGADSPDHYYRNCPVRHGKNPDSRHRHASSPRSPCEKRKEKPGEGMVLYNF